MMSSSGRRRGRENSESQPPSKRRKIITDEEIVEYIVNKAQKKVAKKLKSSEVDYDDSKTPFSVDSLFVWRKKLVRDVTRNGVDYLSVEAVKKRQRERLAEIQKLKKRREERALEKAQHYEEMALVARQQRARAEFDDWEKKEREFESQQNRLREDRVRAKQLNGDKVEEEESCSDYDRRPKYITRVHTGFEWNKYDRVHYDHDNPPPKKVQGYKFDVFYPDLVNQSKHPIYSVEKDGDSAETCIIRFQGEPYDDLAFRIVNGEWDYSPKKGFRCTFENSILRLYFNFKRFR